MYENFAKFITASAERRFNDALMLVVITEIKLKSGEVNVNLILPRYKSKWVWSGGEYYPRSGYIHSVVPTKALEEMILLVKNGSKIDFDDSTAIKRWIESETGISQCAMVLG